MATKDTTTTQDLTPQEQAVQDAIAPVVGENPTGDLKARMDQALAVNGVATPEPTMVNGHSVVGKKLNADGTAWEHDPESTANSQNVRPQDLLDRIGEHVQHEGLRMVLEEMWHWIVQLGGKSAANVDTTSLPDGMPAMKSTASLRQDVSGQGGLSSGGPGPLPAPVTAEGTSAVSDDAPVTPDVVAEAPADSSADTTATTKAKK